jgi:hypothetical protein
MASAGITLAVMLAFVSLKSSLPKAAGLPAALAREGAPVVLALPSAWPPSLSAPVAQPTASALAPVTNLEAAPVAAPPTAPAVVPARPTPAPGRPAPATSPKLAIEPADASRAGETSAAAPAETDAVTPVEITVAKQAEPSAAKPAAGETGEPAALPDFGSRD